MKSYFTKAVSAGVVTLTMVILPLTLPAQAQVQQTQPGVQTTPAPGTRVEEDEGFDWGWLGLLGLLGLAGLAGRKRNDEPTRYRDPNAVGSTTYRE
ncbi:WGxxGxxG family protein [Chlorogloeopsis sp. ULAP01]|uniref:WGxxGxxG family protein n=1 Tax=Chlorogloeopsis sp. ULAP01 TaxID=3056483 RepID=UPI0025AA634C|nr:WGxxGxxG family protein [Chlorogloeopsis sp. ULAP01]MDM9380494.1 WGxxGxxG family protein [Chlorogloeopsis sp. ULAP01]